MPSHSIGMGIKHNLGGMQHIQNIDVDIHLSVTLKHYWHFLAVNGYLYLRGFTSDNLT
ncbi:hypothetical protein Nos7524_4379 [Nostoc sp. PCC 7524]|uniref:hypothetical protein n=1 Tax=Nostoc sp. (strain ATCC 29411 / PCC 7524) TaxID=28072 RepID=UPI00029F1E36|nr:hypothetical protein [Nostoc sp. PCC 7524]AFY50138.1 hypothetical protein Nos7524_4379 [Nostoc sp. PCC 7524]